MSSVTVDASGKVEFDFDEDKNLVNCCNQFYTLLGAYREPNWGPVKAGRDIDGNGDCTPAGKTINDNYRRMYNAGIGTLEKPGICCSGPTGCTNTFIDKTNTDVVAVTGETATGAEIYQTCNKGGGT